MHLNAEQIIEIELLQGNTSNNNSNDIAQNDIRLQHFKQCELCQQKLQNLKEFRNKLANDTSHELPAMQWQAIEREIDASNKANVVTSINTKIKRLQVAFIAIAASLLVLLVYPQFANQSNNAAQRELVSIVEQNHLLQKELNKNKEAGFLQTVSYRTKETQLQEIDYKIQLSYLDNLTIEQKITLWSERKKLLTQLLNNKNQPTIVFI